MAKSELSSQLSRRAHVVVRAIEKEHKKGSISVAEQRLADEVALALTELREVLVELQRQGLIDHGDVPGEVALSGSGILLARQLGLDSSAVLSVENREHECLDLSPTERVPEGTVSGLSQPDLEFMERFNRAIKNFSNEVAHCNMSNAEKAELLRRAREFFEHPAVLELLRRAALRN